MPAPISFTVKGDDGQEVELHLPAKYVVCRSCEGEGGTPLFTAGLWVCRRFCEECLGMRVVAVPDELACNPDTLARFLLMKREAATHQKLCELARKEG